MISVTDLKKPVIRKDIIIDKQVVNVIRGKGGLDLIVEQLLDEIKQERSKQKKKEGEPNGE